MVPRTRRAIAGIVVLVALTAAAGIGAGATASPGDGAGSATGALLENGAGGAPADENLSAYRTHWRGQILAATAEPESAGAVYQIRNYTDGDFGALVTEFRLDDAAGTTIDSGRLASGQYVIVDENKTPRAPVDGDLSTAADASEAWWEVAVQELTVEAEDRSFGEPLPLEIRSNRGTYEVLITSPQLNASDLVGVLPDDGEVERRDDETVAVAAGADTTFMVDLQDVPPGEYELGLRVADTGISDDVTLTRAEPEEVANVDEEVIQSTRGAVPTVRINLQDTDAADIAVGSDAASYRTSFTVVDGNEDGIVAFRLNTYRAGGIADEAAAYEPVDEEDEIRDLRRESAPQTDSLPVGDYEVTVSVDREVTDLATLVLSEQTVGDMQLRIAPDVGFGNDPDQVRQATIPADSVALEDGLVFHVEADGLAGLLEPGYDLDPTSPDAAEHGAFLEIVPANETGATLDLSAGETIPDGDGGVYFAVPVETEPVGVEAGTSYTATFTVAASNPLVDETLTRSINATIEERSVDFAGREGDIVTFEDVGSSLISDGDVALSGVTSVAPGTELVVVLRSDDPLAVVDQTAVVTSRREWEAEFETPAEVDNFTVHVRDGPDTISDHVLAVRPDPDEPAESGTSDPSDDEADGDGDDEDPGVHPVLIAIGAAAVTGWALIRYRGPIRSTVRRDPGADGQREANSASDQRPLE